MLLVCSVGVCRMKKNEKKRKKLEIHVGMCRCNVYFFLPFPTCRCSKYAELLRFLRSRFYFGGRGDFLNDFGDLDHTNGRDRKKML